MITTNPVTILLGHARARSIVLGGTPLHKVRAQNTRGFGSVAFYKNVEDGGVYVICTAAAKNQSDLYHEAARRTGWYFPDKSAGLSFYKDMIQAMLAAYWRKG